MKKTFSFFFFSPKNPNIYDLPRAKASSKTTSCTWSMIPGLVTGGLYKQAGPAEVQA